MLKFSDLLNFNIQNDLKLVHCYKLAKIENKFPKPVDKSSTLWYNKIVERYSTKFMEVKTYEQKKI